VLRQSSQIEKKVKEFGDTADVDVLLLRQQIQTAQAELDELDAEADAFEAAVDFQVREPMEQIDGCRRRMAAERAHLVFVQPQLSEKIEKGRRENERLALQNEELRGKIEALEARKRKMSPAVAAAVEEVMIASPRPMILFERRIFQTNHIREKDSKGRGEPAEKHKV
jgi:cell division protein FtsB